MDFKYEKGKKLVLVSLSLFVLSNLVDVSYNLWNIKDALVSNIGSIIPVFLRICLVMGFATEAWKGINWARWGVIVLAIITIIFSMPGLVFILLQDSRVLIFGVIIILNSLTFGLMMFQKDIKEYYRYSKTKVKDSTKCQ